MLASMMLIVLFMRELSFDFLWILTLPSAELYTYAIFMQKQVINGIRLADWSSGIIESGDGRTMKQSKFRGSLFLLLLCLVASEPAFASNSPDAEKGNALLKSMSEKLAAAKNFAFHTTEFHDTVNR